MTNSQLHKYRNIHADETVIVCGCGPSLRDLPDPESQITIGVNDVGRLFDPNYLVVLNMRRQFKSDRFRHVESSRAQALFTQLNLGIKHPNIVRFNLGKRGGTDCSDSASLPFTRNSPYVALCLAIFMGARRIGLIGVDFTEHHFFGSTGTHPLSRQFNEINREYEALNAAAAANGVEIFNLSRQSRISAFPKMDATAFCTENAPTQVTCGAVNMKVPRVFCVNYRFLSCGDVFTTGLQHAADHLGVNYQAAYWDDPQLANKIALFSPDLLLVVHGRKFIQKWRNRIHCKNAAVWLLDEPYEVDDTANYSRYFGKVFLNDPNTLSRHENAHYLPVAYDPLQHSYDDQKKIYQAGFIGGHNKTRERFLLQTLEAGYLSYVVGGPWKDRRLQAICRSRNISPQETAALYRQTRIVINVFRDTHHFNKNKIPGYALNPRVYEALACGALVVSENRPELSEVFPELPVFESGRGLVERLGYYLENETSYQQVLQDCIKQLAGHSYENRLQHIMEVCMNEPVSNKPAKTGSVETLQSKAPAAPTKQDNIPRGWSDHGGICARRADGSIVFRMDHNDAPGAELGTASTESYQNVELSFEIRLGKNTCFIAKVHQQSQLDQASNSYHLICRNDHCYLAMHNHVFESWPIRFGRWQKITLRHRRNHLELLLNDESVFDLPQNSLPQGFCFLGIKGGEAKLRNINLGHGNPVGQLDSAKNASPGYRIEQDFSNSFNPTVSIVTTVYDRVECLGNCLESVAKLQLRDFEHIIVADHPPAKVFAKIKKLVGQHDNGQTSLVNLRKRHNDWGIAPASAGLSLSRGRYVCFLSDDNGYTPDHLTHLVDMLDRNNNIGFAYSSCRYDGRFVLRGSVPRPGGIDLGQPLFRRELFEWYFDGGLPFDMMAWDWHMMDALMKHGVRWRHVNKPTFLFRLDKYLSGQRRVAS